MSKSLKNFITIRCVNFTHPSKVHACPKYACVCMHCAFDRLVGPQATRVSCVLCVVMLAARGQPQLQSSAHISPCCAGARGAAAKNPCATATHTSGLPPLRAPPRAATAAAAVAARARGRHSMPGCCMFDAPGLASPHTLALALALAAAAAAAQRGAHAVQRAPAAPDVPARALEQDGQLRRDDARGDARARGRAAQLFSKRGRRAALRGRQGGDARSKVGGARRGARGVCAASRGVRACACAVRVRACRQAAGGAAACACAAAAHKWRCRSAAQHACRAADVARMPGRLGSHSQPVSGCVASAHAPCCMALQEEELVLSRAVADTQVRVLCAARLARLRAAACWQRSLLQQHSLSMPLQAPPCLCDVLCDFKRHARRPRSAAARALAHANTQHAGMHACAPPRHAGARARGAVRQHQHARGGGRAVRPRQGDQHIPGQEAGRRGGSRCGAASWRCAVLTRAC